ncbi:MAG TPA: NlpC/P60 family protein [Acidimicrobiales bacterium]|nr:NlpC/P60 family protein [Acidimicrobiales bacterium]
MTVVTVCSGTVMLVSRPAVGDTISTDRAIAAQIEAQLAAAQAKMSALSQQYDAAANQLAQINANIASTKAAILADQKQVAADKVTLSKAAVSNYITAGAASNQNPIFSGNQKTLGAANEYNKIVAGDITAAVAALHTAENTLTAQETTLQTQQTQAQQAVAAERAAISQNAQAVAAQSAALAQEKGKIAQLVQAAQAAQLAAQQRTARAVLAAASSSQFSNAAPPPTAPGGAGAVQAAEGQLGVPYRWGAESPKGSSDPGFDCSGLTAWSWGQVGVGLAHYSGAQMANSAPVPLSDLQPGDLLFYGPGGSDHVAMYIGGGQMVEAPYTGAYVWNSPVRLGGNFAGAGRP